MTITSGFIMNWYYIKKAELDIAKFWKESIPVIMVAIVMSCISYLLKRGEGVKNVSVVHFGIEVLIYSVVYAFIMYLCVMKSDEKEQIFNLVKHKKYGGIGVRPHKEK